MHLSQDSAVSIWPLSLQFRMFHVSIDALKDDPTIFEKELLENRDQVLAITALESACISDTCRRAFCRRTSAS